MQISGNGWSQNLVKWGFIERIKWGKERDSSLKGEIYDRPYEVIFGLVCSVVNGGGLIRTYPTRPNCRAYTVYFLSPQLT